MLRIAFYGSAVYACVSLTVDPAFAQQCQPTSHAAASVSETAGAGGTDKEVSIDFDHFATATAPEGFLSIVNGTGKPADWEIRPEPTAPSSPNVLAQISMETESFRFPLLIYKKFAAKNVEVTVQFKPVSGKIDQAAGVVARYQDETHFYVVRANAFENDVRLYKVVDGVRHPISGASALVTTGKWHDVQLSVNGTHFRVCFDGIPLFEAEDDTYQQAGRVGLSTKSDGVIAFDNLHVVDMEEP